jgi:hypothetical protein
MEINSHNDIDMENNSVTPLPTPHFDAEMISEAQQVEPLEPRGRQSWRSGPLQNFVRGRLGLLIGIVIALLLGAAAFGMFLGLRDRQNPVETAETANQATPEPTSDAGATTPTKAQIVKAPVKSLARTQPVEDPRRETKPAPERVRRVLASPAEIDQALSGRGDLPMPRKVGELFGDGRRSERRGHKGEGHRRDRNDDDHE